MNIDRKLEILADAAKYDVSCVSSGSKRPNKTKGLGNAAAGGICHTFTEDGRCVSLFKILFTNYCIYDCAYCVNRNSNDIPRAAFTPREIVSLTIDFYRRNYIEGLFLSSGVVKSPDDTMELLIRVAKDLREIHGFNGYIHLKCVPNAGRTLTKKAGLFADRLSINIEIPSEAHLKRLTGEKNYPGILTPMTDIKEGILENRRDRKVLKNTPVFTPAGQSTQLIVGASPESDFDVLKLSTSLYREKSLKRVYYSGYIPVNALDSRLPKLKSPPLVREHRLYQADWLYRFYGFSLDDIISPETPFLDTDKDPKLAHALKNPYLFPVDINRADKEMLLKVPGIGPLSARRIVNSRRFGQIRYEYLKKFGVVLKRAAPFITCTGMSMSDFKTKPNPRNVFIQAAPRPHASRNTQNVKSIIFTYDNTFDGLLTVVFESYARKIKPEDIRPDRPEQGGLFETRMYIPTDLIKAKRVWKRLIEKFNNKTRGRIYAAFLANAPNVEMTILSYILGRIRTTGQWGNQADNIASFLDISASCLSGYFRYEEFDLSNFNMFYNRLSFPA